METPPPDPRIERARALYVDSDVPVRAIAHRVGVPMTTLGRWIARFGWPMRGPRRFGRASRPDNTELPATPPKPAATPRPPAAVTGRSSTRTDAKPPPRIVKRRKRPTTATLVDRLYRIITHNLETMESRMSDDEQTANGNPERDARAIGNLVRSVEKLKELEPEHSKRDAGAAGTGRYPLSPGEEDKLRDEIVERLLKLRERMGDQATRR